MNVYKVKLIRTLAALLVLLHASISSAQDFKQAITNLSQGYEKMDRLHVVMVIQAFEDSLLRKPYYTEKADVKRDGKNYAYHLTNMEMLMNTQYMVVVDRNLLQIVCSKRDIKGEEDFFGKDHMTFNLDSMLTTLKGEPRFMGKNNTVERYMIFQREGAITKIDLRIDTHDNVLQHLAYSYKDGQYVTIDFEVFDKQPAFKPDTFDEAAYLVFDKGIVKTSTAYQHYAIQEVKN